MVVDWNGDAGAPHGLGKLGKLGGLGDVEVAFLGPELGAVDRAVGGVRYRRQLIPHIVSRAGETSTSRTHHITWTPSGLAYWWKASIGELRTVLVPVYYIDNG